MSPLIPQPRRNPVRQALEALVLGRHVARTRGKRARLLLHRAEGGRQRPQRLDGARHARHEAVEAALRQEQLFVIESVLCVCVCVYVSLSHAHMPSLLLGGGGEGAWAPRTFIVFC